jgi:hypothetical protein
MTYPSEYPLLPEVMIRAAMRDDGEDYEGINMMMDAEDHTGLMEFIGSLPGMASVPRMTIDYLARLYVLTGNNSFTAGRQIAVDEMAEEDARQPQREFSLLRGAVNLN